MGQSLSKLYVHLIFSTKNRQPFITPIYEDSLHRYISGTFKNLNSPVIAINSMPDHLHVLFVLSKNYFLAGTVEEVKKSSSKWMKSQGCEFFSWQIGYGGFSVSQSNVDVVTKYIENQKEHHKKISFEEEVKDFMIKYEMGDFNDEYFWR